LREPALAERFHRGWGGTRGNCRRVSISQLVRRRPTSTAPAAFVGNQLPPHYRPIPSAAQASRSSGVNAVLLRGGDNPRWFNPARQPAGLLPRPFDLYTPRAKCFARLKRAGCTRRRFLIPAPLLVPGTTSSIATRPNPPPIEAGDRADFSRIAGAVPRAFLGARPEGRPLNRKASAAAVIDPRRNAPRLPHKLGRLSDRRAASLRREADIPAHTGPTTPGLRRARPPGSLPSASASTADSVIAQTPLDGPPRADRPVTAMHLRPALDRLTPRRARPPAPQQRNSSARSQPPEGLRASNARAPS